AKAPGRLNFTFPARREVEPLRIPNGPVIGVIERREYPIRASVELSGEYVGDRLFRVTVRVMNDTLLVAADGMSREDVRLRSLASTHTILGMRGGAFVSLLDPPEELRSLAAECRNVGTWPVLVGEEGHRDAMLSSPIILYDYPHVAPESPG